MELGDTSDEEASRPLAKKREMSKNQRIQMVSMLQMLLMEDSMRRGAFTIVTECCSMAHSTVHCLWNRVACMRTSSHVISLEFHSHKKIVGDSLCIHWSSSARESRTSHYGSSRLKESWQHQWGCQRRWCIVGLLIRLYEFIPIPCSLSSWRRTRWLGF